MIEYITLGILIFGVVAGIARSIWGSPRSTADIADSIKAIELNIHGVVKSQALLLDKVEWIEDLPSKLLSPWGKASLRGRLINLTTLFIHFTKKRSIACLLLMQ